MNKFWKAFWLFYFVCEIYCMKENYRIAVYFVNWAIYQRNFIPQDLPAEYLTHIFYAFANVNSTTGEIYLSDNYADTQILFDGDQNEGDNDLYGCLKQLYLLKKRNRNLKTLLSIGGATYSTNFAEPISSSSGRLQFASSAIDLIENFGLDGIDIDWEFPSNEKEASNYVLLLQSVRQALDSYGNSLPTPYHFILTVGGPAGSSNYEILQLLKMDQYVDFWNLLTFDYVGKWSNSTGNQAAFFPDTSNPASTPFNSNSTINYYLSQGIAASKLVLGMPLYGRSFEKTDGLGKSFNGVGPGTWEPGIYDYKSLPLPGAAENVNLFTESSWSHDHNTHELISYDNVQIAARKALRVQQIGLGGMMWWESSADRVGSESLIETASDVLGGEDLKGLDNSINQLDYPNAYYKNLRDGMPLVSVSSLLTLNSTSPITSSTSTVTSSTSVTSPVKSSTSTVTSSTSVTSPVTSSVTSSPVSSDSILTSTLISFTTICISNSTSHSSISISSSTTSLNITTIAITPTITSMITIISTTTAIISTITTTVTVRMY